MLSLAETQARLCDAILSGDGGSALPLVTGGADPAARLAIHLRHYEASLAAALIGKFPACVWLLGERFVAGAARKFVHRRPPMAPCIAEYGADFPGFLAGLPTAGNAPYLRWFAELEWQLGHVSVAIDHPSLEMMALAALSGDALAELVLRLQPGLVYFHSPWPVNELMKLYLSDSAPDRYVLEPGDAWLEIAGARGAFRFDRLDPAEFAFRQRLAAGTPIGAAAELALDADTSFDPGRALTKLFTDRLVIAADPGVAP
jgi:hypothetical protein